MSITALVKLRKETGLSVDVSAVILATRNFEVLKMIGTKEHYDLLENFERNFKYLRLDREKNKELWKIQAVYENGETNMCYRAFLLGYSLAKSMYQN
jgi:ethanolamine utilization protein EutA (predicted chaperonin)